MNLKVIVIRHLYNFHRAGILFKQNQETKLFLYNIIIRTLRIDKIHIVEQKSSILQYILYQPYLLDLTRTLQTYFYKLSHLYQILLIEKATPIK